MDHRILPKALRINLYSSYADLSHGERSALQKQYLVCQRSLKYTHFRCMFFEEKRGFHRNGKGKQFSTEEKSKIMCWGEIGIKSKEIAARLGRRERAVWIHLSVLKKLPPNGSLLPPKARSGRPSKTSKAQDKRLKAYVEKYPFKSARQLKNEVVGWADVSVRTLQKRLKKKLGLPSHFFDFRACLK
jgi:transposase